MINCQNCNAQVPEGTKFCPSCGTPVQETNVPEVNQGYIPQEPVNYQNQEVNTGYSQPVSGNGVPQGYAGPQMNGGYNSWQPNDNTCQSMNPMSNNEGYMSNNEAVSENNTSYIPNNQPQDASANGYMPNSQPYNQNQANGFNNGYSQSGYNPNMSGGVPQGAPMNYGMDMSPEAKDAQDNKFMGILSYVGVLCLIPLFGAKNSPFAQYHAKQGFTVAVISMGWTILKPILKAIFSSISWSLYCAMLTPLSLITTAVSIFTLVVGIMGIVNVCKGECKELPLIGKIKILK